MITSLADANKIRVEPLPLPRNYNDFLGNLPKNSQWNMLLFGASFSGKTSFAIKFAGTLARLYKVLYVNVEENLQGGTLQTKARTLNVYSRNLFFLDRPDLNKIRTALNTGDFKYCIIDSLSALSSSMKTAMEVFNLKDEFQDISFIFIVHSDKTEKRHLGSSTFKHNVDIALEVRDRIVHQIKNRFKKTRKFTDFKIYRN